MTAPAQNDPQIPGSNDSGEEQPLRTRYYYLIMTVMVVIGVVIDIAIYIGIITNAEGTVRIPYLVFILPVIGALAIGRFADAALAKKSPHLVPGYVAPQYQGGQVPQQAPYGQPQYGQPAAQPVAPQSTGYGQGPGQAPGQQTAPGAPQQALYGQPQQPGQVPPSDQYSQPQQVQSGQAPAVQAPQNQQPYSQGGQSGQTGPVGY